MLHRRETSGGGPNPRAVSQPLVALGALPETNKSGMVPGRAAVRQPGPRLPHSVARARTSSGVLPHKTCVTQGCRSSARGPPKDHRENPQTGAPEPGDRGTGARVYEKRGGGTGSGTQKFVYRGGGDIPCGGKYEPTNSGATKSLPLLKNERTNDVWFPAIAHEKQWALAVITCTNP